MRETYIFLHPCKIGLVLRAIGGPVSHRIDDFGQLLLRFIRQLVICIIGRDALPTYSSDEVPGGLKKGKIYCQTTEDRQVSVVDETFTSKPHASLGA